MITDNAVIEHGFKVLIGALVAILSWFFSRYANKTDDEILEVKNRVAQLEDEKKEVIKLSVKMDMMIQAMDKTNKTLDDVSKRVQGVELGIARMGGKSK